MASPPPAIVGAVAEAQTRPRKHLSGAANLMDYGADRARAGSDGDGVTDVDMVSVIVEWAKSRGWTIQTDAGGCRRFYDPDGNYIAYWAPTPENRNYRW